VLLLLQSAFRYSSNKENGSLTTNQLIAMADMQPAPLVVFCAAGSGASCTTLLFFLLVLLFRERTVDDI
jgi:hypothetical protein